MRATSRNQTTRQTCINLITDSIYHGLNGHSWLHIFFACSIIVPAYDCHRLSKDIIASSCFTKSMLFFIEFSSQGERMKNELS